MAEVVKFVPPSNSRFYELHIITVLIDGEERVSVTTRKPIAEALRWIAGTFERADDPPPGA